MKFHVICDISDLHKEYVKLGSARNAAMDHDTVHDDKGNRHRGIVKYGHDCPKCKEIQEISLPD